MKKVPYILIGLFLLFLISPFGKDCFCQRWPIWLYFLFFSGLISFFFTPIMRWTAFRFKMLDYPAERKVHDKPTPLLGGVAVYLGVVVTIVLNHIIDKEIVAILIGGTILLLVGVINDKKEVPAKFRLLIQIAITFFVVKSGVSLTLFPDSSLLGPYINIFLSLLWIVGITNSMNFFDGMDGLATGLSMISAFFIALIAFIGGQPLLGWMAVAIVGASLGFFPYNFRIRGAATIFLGESGSTFLGFILSCIAIKGEWADSNPIVSLTAPLLIFSIFIYDTTYITVSRVLEGKVRNFRQWVDYVGKDHIHHRMDALLQGKKKSVILIYFLAIALGLTALLIKRATTEIALLLLLQAVVILAVVTVLEREGNRRMRS